MGASSLVVIVGKDRASDDRDIRIASSHIMRKLFDERKEVFERFAVDLHRNMLFIQDNTMFIVVHIRRVLQSVFSVSQIQFDDPVVLSGRMAGIARESDIFFA